MKNLEPKPNISNLESSNSASLLTKDELNEFRKLPKEEQEKQQEERLKKLEELQNKFRSAVEVANKTGNPDQAVKLKADFDKNAEELKQLLSVSSNSISTEYIYKDDEGKKTKETIKIDIEKKLKQSILFYKEHKIDLPKDFENTIKGIWVNHEDEITKEIQKKGFDEILIVPGGLSLPELHKKMTSGNAYESYWKDKNISDMVGKSFEWVKETTNKTRIVLLHWKNAQNIGDRPELGKTRREIAEKFIKAGEKLTLTDYLIFQRQYNEKTCSHLDNEGSTLLPGATINVKNRRLPGTTFRDDVKYVVHASWSRNYDTLCVGASEADNSRSDYGCRLSRTFY